MTDLREATCRHLSVIVAHPVERLSDLTPIELGLLLNGAYGERWDFERKARERLVKRP